MRIPALAALVIGTGAALAMAPGPAEAQNPGNICYGECDRHYEYEQDRCMDGECEARAEQRRKACYGQCENRYGADRRGRCYTDASGAMVCRD